jgi:macrolide transport system ATP-binding/permease protein
MIELRGVSKTYRMGDVDVHALREVSLTIERGEFVAIMGPSGSGKSTLMHVLGLLDVPDAGSYKLLGREVSGLDEDALAALRADTLGFVFQQFNLLARTPALENAALPLLYAAAAKDPSRPRKLLEQVGLGARLDHKPNELSGGQQQRVAIARALVNDPAVLFADEPTGNLDSASEKEILEVFTRLNEAGLTVILVTHEPEIAGHAKRVIRMRDGRVQSDERRAPLSAPRKPSAGLSPLPLGEDRERGGILGDLRQHFRQALRSLSANKVRTALSMLGILIGVAAVIAMLALGAGARQAIEERLSSMGSNLLVLRPGARQSGAVSLESRAATRLTLEDAEALREVPGVRRTGPSVGGRAQVVYGGRNWNTRVQGAGPEYEAMRAARPVAGRFFTEAEDRSRARVALVGATLVRELFGGKSPVGETIKLNRVGFLVVGVLPVKGDSGWRDQDDVVVVPIRTAMRRLLGQDHVESIDVEVESASRMEAVQAEMLALMGRRHRVPASREGAFEVRNMAELQEALTATQRTMTLLLSSIAAISLLVGGIGIMNIMLVSVTERTREIGLRKALGARRGDILAQFLIEAVVVSAAGGLAGICLGWLVTSVMTRLAGWAASVSAASVLLSFFFSAGVGVAFGLWPARRASLLNPIQALRYE